MLQAHFFTSGLMPGTLELWYLLPLSVLIATIAMTSGVGASVAANKLPGVRAGLCHDTYSAHQGVEHDDMNVLVLGGRVVGAALARELVAAFLQARVSEEERHQRRRRKIQVLEQTHWEVLGRDS